MSAEKRRFIGIDLGGSKIRFNYIDFLGNTSLEYQAAIKDSLSNTQLVEIVVLNLQRLTNKILEEKNEIGGIGFGSPGPLDYKNGIIETPPNLPNIRNLSIVRILKELFPECSTFLVHDADATLIGERWLGTAKNLDNVAMVTFGTGVGFAVMDNGQLIRGKGRASEAGHTDVSIDVGGIDASRFCSCGKTNHWEAYVGTNGLAKTYCSVFGRDFHSMSSAEKYSVSFEFRNWLSSPYESKWPAVLDYYCYHVVIGLMNIVSNFDPECIILGGGIINGNEPLFRAIKNGWMAVGTELRLAKLPDAGVIGAAKYAMDMTHQERELRAAEHGIIT